ncbi:MAG: hypothetical protein L0323_15765 [Planctomycetes bacterium]|nr:hypothetical protein [Planctomycetota bacterium]
MGIRPSRFSSLLLGLAACAYENPSIHMGPLLGHRFVAEGVVYTAGHLEPTAVEVAPDLVALESTGRRGFEVCRDPHAVGDEVLLRGAAVLGADAEARGRLIFEGPVLAVELERDVFQGLSGAPVFCARHGRVLGALVAGHERTAVVTPIPARPRVAVRPTPPLPLD